MKTAGTVSDILARKGTKVWFIAPSATVFEAIKQMSDLNIGALPVVREGKVVGILSERDYTRKVVLQGKTSKQTTVEEIMTSSVVTATPGQSVDECMAIMTQTRARHLPVISDGQLVGLVSIGDLVKWTISAQNAALEQMENYITGSYYA